MNEKNILPSFLMIILLTFMGFLFIHGLYYHRIDINPQYARYPVNSRVFSNNKTNPQISDVLNYEKCQEESCQFQKGAA